MASKVHPSVHSLSENQLKATVQRWGYKAIVRRYPEILSEIKLLSQPKGGDVLVQYRDIVNAAIELFAVKLGLALHYETTSRIVPSTGMVSPHFYTNYQALNNYVPPSLFSTFSNYSTLWQGKKHVGDQFQY